MGKFGKVLIRAAISAALTFAFTPAAGFTFSATSTTFLGRLAFKLGITFLSRATVTALSFIGSAALGFVSQAFTPSPKLPQSAPLSQRSVGRLRQFQSPITAWRFVVGETRVSGPTVFVESTDSNKFLHMVIVVSADEVDSIVYAILAEDPIYPDELDGNGLINTGKFSGKVRFKFHLGTAAQTADSDLVNEVTNWTSDHRIRGRAYIYVRLEFDKDLFPSSVPAISTWLRGWKTLDVRDSTTRWSPNTMLAIRKYVTRAVDQGGMGFDASEDVDDTFVTAAANTCDEIVGTEDVTTQVSSVDTSNDVFVLDGDIIPYQTGDRVQVSFTGGEPTGLSPSTNYYAIITKPKKTETSNLEMGFAASYANALAGTKIDITSSGSGSGTVTKNGEPRYTSNGIIETERPTGEILDELLASMAGRASHIGSDWKFYAGAARSATLSFDETDILGDLVIQTKHPRSARFNAVRGSYISPLNNSAPDDFPPYLSSVYLTEDNGERTFKDLELSFTSRPHMAQRISKIELERHRQQITVTATMQITGFLAQPGDVIQFSLSRMGWTDKLFELAEHNLVTVPGGPNNEPGLAVSWMLIEYAAAAFDWVSADDETAVDPAPDTNLPDAFATNTPSNLLVTEELFTARDGGGVKARAIMSWTAPSDSFIRDYIPEYKLSIDTDWIELAPTTTTTANIDDITPGTYNFRVTARNVFLISSDPTTKTEEILGLGADPSDPTGLTISTLGGVAILRWDKSTDLDVTEGGKVHIRHDKDTTGAGLTTSVSVIDPLDGSSTSAHVPLKEGTYLVFFEDTTSNRSGAASVSTEQATVLVYTNLSSISEHSVFSGVHSNTAAVDSKLQLTGSDQMDDWTDVDLVADWDTGEGGLNTSGTYTFSASFDFGSKVRKRLTTEIDVLIISPTDTVDSRTDNIDTWPDFDGTIGVDADAVVFVRYTDDDPIASPTWSAWQRLEAGEFHARAFQFKVVLTTPDNSFNIQVSTLSVHSEDLA